MRGGTTKCECRSALNEVPSHQGAKISRKGRDEDQGHKAGKHVLILEGIESHRRFQSKEVTDANLSLGQSLCWPGTEALEAKGQIRRRCNGSAKRRWVRR